MLSRRATLFSILACFVALASAAEDRGTLRGRVTDPSGAAVPGARVEAQGPRGTKRSTSAGGDGSYVLPGLPPGAYTIVVTRKGFSAHSGEVRVETDTVADVQLDLAPVEENVTVESRPPLDLSPDNNAGALVLKGEDLESLPEDPDELAEALQALAGPAAGPNGGQIFVDGFTGGRVPPLSAILEIRINANPFSAEYDRIGFGRIEILTRPGSEHLRGNASFRFNDESLNTQNPYAPNKPPYQRRDWSGDLSGPVVKGKASYFVDFEDRAVDDNEVVNATILDPDLNVVPYNEALVTPQRRISVSPRLDVQLGASHTVSARYSYTETERQDSGIGGFSLPSRGYDSRSTQNIFQLADTLILGKKAVSQTRLRYWTETQSQAPASDLPTLQVLDSFTGGGASAGDSSHREKRWELQNTTSWSAGRHALRAGFRLRTVDVHDDSRQNFAGTLTFAGGFGPQSEDTGAVLVPLTSIERYRRTLLLQGQGLTSAQIRALGGGPSQLLIAGGDPLATVSQWDLAPFVQDDWRVRDDLTLSAGLRYEVQDNVSSPWDFAPRLAFAWSPGAKAGPGGPPTVVRGGFGIFYDRVDDSLTLQARRYDGVTRQQYLVTDPTLLDTIPYGPDGLPILPSVDELAAFAQPQAIRVLAPGLRAPYTIQSSLSVERRLPLAFTGTATLILSQGRRLLRSRVVESQGRSDDGSVVYQYESTGRSNQAQWILGLNNRTTRGFSVYLRYFLGWARSDTDGAATFPADGGDLLAEYGDAGIDVRHRFVLGGSVPLPWGIRLSPFVTAASGKPYNITTGRDNNRDTVFADRPAFATDPTRPDVVATPYGPLDPSPLPGQALVPRNLGRAPGFFAVNLRIAKVIPLGKPVASPGVPDRERPPAGPGGGGFGRGMRGGGGRRGGGGDADEGGGRRLTLSIQVQNLFNTVNPAAPVGNLSSPLFGQSTASAGFFGFGGGGAAGSSGAGNRRIDLQARVGF